MPVRYFAPRNINNSTSEAIFEKVDSASDDDKNDLQTNDFPPKKPSRREGNKTLMS